jgi:hypothetical protein
MILFPAMLVGGHLLVAVVDRVPDLNFEPICRDRAAESLGVKDDSAVCMKDETAARDQLAKTWDEFASADRTRCLRMSTMERTASYIEVLTCLEMDRDAKKLRQGADAGIAAPEPAPGRAPEDGAPPVRGARMARQPAPAPLPLAPPAPASSPGILHILCLPGLQNILPACQPSR